MKGKIERDTLGGWNSVSCYDWVEDEDFIWFSLIDKNAICEVEKKTRKINIIGEFEGAHSYEKKLSYSVVQNEEYVLFSPFAANEIIAIKKSSKEKITFKIPVIPDISLNNYRKEAKFFRTLEEGSKFFLLGLFFPGIICVDIEKKTLEVDYSWTFEVDQRAKRNAGYITDGSLYYEKEYYLPIGKGNGLLNVNFYSHTNKYKSLDIPFNGILGITQYGDRAFLTNHDKEAAFFCEWEIKTNKFKNIKMPFRDAFYAPVLCGKYLFFWGNYNRGCFQYDIETSNIEDVTSVFDGLGKITAAKSVDKEIRIFVLYGRGYYDYNPYTKKIRLTKLVISDDLFLKNTWNDYIISMMKMIKERPLLEEELSLQNYINCINS